MKRIIELKHVRAKPLVRTLLNELIDRLEEKLQHFQPDTITVHALFEENSAHKLFRTALTCHIPGQTVAVHEENRDAGTAIRDAFSELERRLEKQKAAVRHERDVRRSQRRSRRVVRRLDTASLKGLLAPSEDADETT
jgi:ribosomal subunit interface protein